MIPARYWKKSLSRTVTIVLLHHVFVIYFMYDFFLARDSFTLDNVWSRTNQTNEYPPELAHSEERVSSQSAKIFQHLCKRRTYISDKNRSDEYSEIEFDKTVLIVIDALGADFIPSIVKKPDSKLMDIQPTMSFVESLLSDKKALGFTGHAATPTVTMPRIKAIVSGTIPSFVDIIYNLAANNQKFESTNIIELAKSRGKQIVFYGDDTWLALFRREIFLRANETFSFFATDYTTVDTNVTSNVMPELERINEWDIMILHYLGLDHIGHVYGSRKSTLIQSKLVEMDNVIKNIFEVLIKDLNQSTLIIICGDHGMSDSGNHGGGSKLEADTAMIFIPINNKYKLDFSSITKEIDELVGSHAINQVDLAVTVSMLTGLPIPDKSKGRLITHIMDTLLPIGSHIKTCAAFENTMQLKTLLTPAQLQILSEELAKILHQHHEGTESSHELYRKYVSWTKRAQDFLLSNPSSEGNFYLVFMIACTFLVVIIVKLLASIKSEISLASLMKRGRCELLSVTIIMFVPILFLGSTDFIEFEPSYWPYFTMLIILGSYTTKLIKDRKTESVVIITLITICQLAIVAICHYWNSNNAMELFKDKHCVLEIIMLCTSSLFLGLRTLGRDCLGRLNNIFNYSIILGITIYKNLAFFGEDKLKLTTITILLARLIFFLILIDFAYSIYLQNSDVQANESSYTGIITRSWLLLVALLLRPHNIILLAMNIMLENVSNLLLLRLGVSPIVHTLFYYTMAKNAFFNQGNSNLFSSIDLAPGYIGQSEYKLFNAAFLIMCSTFSLYTYWILEFFRRYINSRTRRSSFVKSSQTRRLLDIKVTQSIILYPPGISVTYFLLVCCILRNHLFIWSVISPKLIYEYSLLVYTTLFLWPVITITTHLDLKTRKEIRLL